MTTGWDWVQGTTERETGRGGRDADVAAVSRDPYYLFPSCPDDRRSSSRHSFVSCRRSKTGTRTSWSGSGTVRSTVHETERCRSASWKTRFENTGSAES